MKKPFLPMMAASLLAALTILFLLAACAPAASPAEPLIAPSPEGPALVVYVQGGDLRRWDQATGQKEILFAAGNATAVTLSDDGQVAAFVRREVLNENEIDWLEQSALWAVDVSGDNPRELVPAADLRRQIGAVAGDSTTFAQLDWIPRTHRLLYSGVRYAVQAEGLSHALPAGVFRIDADTGQTAQLAGANESLRFVPAPDAQQVALLSSTALDFIAVDGSERRRGVLTYPQAGVPLPVFPVGVWARDAGSFVLAGPGESATPAALQLAIWRVPRDGAPAAPLASIMADSHPASVTFSPDGRQAAYYHWPEPAWLVVSLADDAGQGAGPLALPAAVEMGYANLHWSPSGAAYAFADDFAGDLFRLCAEAVTNADTCGESLALGGIAAGMRWLDATRFLYLTREPAGLFLATTTGAPATPIVTWLPDEAVGLGSFAAALRTPEP